jgi:hypothetical protein
MHLNFRQGLISFQQSGPQALFLVPSTKAGCIDINVTPTPLIGTIAHGSSDYLLQFDGTIHAAFGPLVADSDNYLYIDLNVLTGLTTYGISLLEPKISSVEPSDAVPGQMWFDLTATVMKIRSNDGTKWLVSPRLVIGKVRNGNVNQIIPALVGTSVGLNVPGRPGFLMLDSLLRPLRTSSGELLTSDSSVRVKTTVGTAGVLALPTNGFVSVRANEAIPAMSLVYFSGPDSVSLASSNPALTTPKVPLGVCQQDLAQNEVGTITQTGEITSDQFNWADAECGLPLYCGWNGEITKTRPQGLQAYRVGYIKNSKTILFYVDSETEPQVLSTAGSIISGTPPITAITSVNGVNEIVTTISMSEASANSNGYMTSSQAQIVSTFDGRTSQNEVSIIDLQASKAPTIHSHMVSGVSGLQAILDGKSDIGHSHPEYALVLHTHPEYSLLQHVHFISEVTGLQAVLNNKSDSTHTHIIPDTDGLQIALDSKAFANHTHTIGNVSGLQANLDSKAPLVHIHGIADVTGLQVTLDNLFGAIGQISVPSGSPFATDILVNSLTVGRGANATTPFSVGVWGDLGVSYTIVTLGTTDFTTIGASSNTVGVTFTLTSWPADDTGTVTYANTLDTALGFQTLAANTFGYFNTAIGANALFSNTIGYNNTASGLNALFSNTDGYDNTASGLNTLYSNTTGSNNAAIGKSAGYGTGTNANTTGSNNTFVGYQTIGATSADTNTIVIGSNAVGLGSNTTVIGNSSTTSAKIFGAVSTSGYTVATLPAGSTGMRAYVTDAVTPSFLADVVGGGSVVTPVFYNGSAWVAG